MCANSNVARHASRVFRGLGAQEADWLPQPRYNKRSPRELFGLLLDFYICIYIYIYIYMRTSYKVRLELQDTIYSGFVCSSDSVPPIFSSS